MKATYAYQPICLSRVSPRQILIEEPRASQIKSFKSMTIHHPGSSQDCWGSLWIHLTAFDFVIRGKNKMRFIDNQKDSFVNLPFSAAPCRKFV